MIRITVLLENFQKKIFAPKTFRFAAIGSPRDLYMKGKKLLERFFSIHVTCKISVLANQTKLNTNFIYSLHPKKIQPRSGCEPS